MSKKFFFDNGFLKLEKLISKKKLITLQREIFQFTNQFSNKINKKEFKKKVSSVDDFSNFCIRLEKHNPKYFFHFVSLVSKLNVMMDLINYINQKKLLTLTSKILNEKKSNLLTSYPPSFLVNLPKNKRVLYHWHTSKNGYPKRRSCVSFWVPLFSNKNKNNGSMMIAAKSHVNDEYPFKEFRDTKRYGKNALTQRIVPKKYISSFKNLILNCKAGSAYAMHHNLLHSSSLNKSKSCSYVLIFKIWSISKDLTLSSRIDQKNHIFDDGYGKEVISV